MIKDADFAPANHKIKKFYFSMNNSNGSLIH